jgi:hypothetical protein
MSLPKVSSNVTLEERTEILLVSHRRPLQLWQAMDRQAKRINLPSVIIRRRGSVKTARGEESRSETLLEKVARAAYAIKLPTDVLSQVQGHEAVSGRRPNSSSQG